MNELRRDVAPRGGAHENLIRTRTRTRAVLATFTVFHSQGPIVYLYERRASGANAEAVSADGQPRRTSP